MEISLRKKRKTAFHLKYMHIECLKEGHHPSIPKSIECDKKVKDQ